MIELSNIVKTFAADTENPVRALRGVSFRIETGDFVTVMGHSGSGKSTLMNILGCLDTPSSGSYALNGADVSKKSRRELAAIRSCTLGFVFQSFQLLPRMSVRQNCELPMQYASGIGGRERRERAEEALCKVGLKEKMQRKPSELSGGQQQRVAIARALVNRPKLLLADEPTGNLDTRTGLEILALLQELNAAGLTLVMVTHEPDVAACGRRTLKLHDGLLRHDTVRNAPTRAKDELAMAGQVDQRFEMP